MKFNKIVALALALVMVFALCACGGGNTDTKTDDTGSASKVDTNTVSVGAIVIARDDVPTDEIYAFVSTIFDNLDAITAQHAKGAELSIEAAASVKGVPYHPGAAKYFAEKGFEVAAVKDGAGNTDSRNLRFVTGGESGTYYAFGSVIAQHATNNAGINVVGLVGNGSQANVQELVDGTADFAFCQSDVMAYAYNGTNLFESKVEGFSTVAALYMEQVQIVTTNPDIKTVADLKGKTVYSSGQGATPEYIVNYILRKNGLEPGKDVTIEYKTAHNELATLAVEGSVDICILPEPFVSKVLSKNESYKRVLDLTEEWGKVSSAKLAQGCLVARADYIEQNPEIIKEFMSFYEASVNFVNNENNAGAVFLAKNGYFDTPQLAADTIPNCNIVFITGEEMKKTATENFTVLFEANPASVGGEMPADALYYLG